MRSKTLSIIFVCMLGIMVGFNADATPLRDILIDSLMKMQKGDITISHNFNRL